jgi:hypothetical protein
MFHCCLYIARKSFEKLSSKLHTINILRQLFGNTCRHIETFSLQFPRTRCSLLRLTFVYSNNLTSANYDMHAKYLNLNTMLDFAEGLSLATSEIICVFDLPEG